MSVEAMQRGAERYRREQQKAGVARVRDYRAWLKAEAEARRAGRKAPPVPAIPSPGDYKAARRAALTTERTV